MPAGERSERSLRISAGVNSSSALGLGMFLRPSDSKDAVDDLLGGRDGGKLVVQTGECSLMHLLGGMLLAVGTKAVERSGGVGGNVYVESEVGSHAHRGGDAVIGGQAANYNLGDVLLAQFLFQRRADEATVHV